MVGLRSASMYDRHYILKYMDAPSRVAFWTMDEAQALFIPSGFGFLFGFPLIGLLVALILYALLKHIKQNVGTSLMRHAAYWYLPGVHKKLKVQVLSEIREYIG